MFGEVLFLRGITAVRDERKRVLRDLSFLAGKHLWGLSPALLHRVFVAE